jgi:hypothetical protein
MRFLQALFPGSYMVMMLRHPIAVACATRQFGRARRMWKRMSYSSLIEHWLHCHELMLEDASAIERLLVVRYEDFVASPDERLADVYRFAGVEPRPSGLHVRTGINDGYFRRWSLARHNPGTGSDIERATEELEGRVGRFGYSLQRPQSLAPLEEVG